MTQEAKPDTPVPSVPTAAEFAGKIRSYFDMTLPEAQPARTWTPAELEAALRRHKAWVDSLATPSAAVAGQRASFKGSDLRGANLAKRDLRGADFAGANLEGALLQGSLLTMACLAGTNLRHADLRGAKLRGAELEGAILDGADVTGARFE